MFYSEYLGNKSFTIECIESTEKELIHFMLPELKQKLIVRGTTTTNRVKPTAYLIRQPKKFDQPKLLALISTLCHTRTVRTIKTFGPRVFRTSKDLYLRLCACLESLHPHLLNLPPGVTAEQVSNTVTTTTEVQPTGNVTPILLVVGVLIVICAAA